MMFEITILSNIIVFIRISVIKYYYLLYSYIYLFINDSKLNLYS